MNYSEMKQAVKLLSNEWDLGKKAADADNDICAWIYLLGILEESEVIVKYKDKGKLVGFCGYSKDNSTKYKFRKKLYNCIKNKLYKSRSIKKLDAFKEYEMNYDYVPKNLKNYFDGEVSILLVDKNYRGKGIGKKILLDVFELAKNDGMKNLKIETDESCNYKFYEILGCRKKYETIIGNKENDKLENSYSEKAFIYEKKL